MSNAMKFRFCLTIFLLSYSTFLFVRCSREQEGRTKRSTDPKKMYDVKESEIADSKHNGAQVDQEPTVLEGIVYFSSRDSSAHLALECDSGKVYWIIGAKRFALSNLKNRKVEILGYIHRAAGEDGDRDSLEVVNFEVIRGEGD